jgi:hypothetical protein
MKYLASVCIIICMLLWSAGCMGDGNTDQGDDGEHAEMLQVLGSLQGKIQDSLTRIDASTASAAQELGKSGISGEEANLIILKAGACPSCISAITFNQNGIVAAAEPKEVHVLIGKDLGDQRIVKEVLEQKIPLMSDLFPLEQGGNASVIEYPVFSREGCLMGAVSLSFSPNEIIAPLARAATEGTDYSIMVAQKDGRILYDPDPLEVGKETFNESLYADFPEILEFARRYSAEWSGHFTYSFYDTGFEKIVRKEAFWTTIGMHGTEWRLIVIREI